MEVRRIRMKKSTTKTMAPVMEEPIEAVVETVKEEIAKLEVTVLADRLNVREKASADSNILTVVKKNMVLPAVKKNKSWYQIEVEGKTGFVMAEFVKAN